MTKEKKFMMFGVILLLISLVGSLSTYAWFTWKSTNNTSITMNIGQLADVIFTSGNDISTSTLAPVYNYTDGEKTTFSINNKDTSGTSINYAVKLNITSIATELKSTDLKYALLKNDTIVKEGDFSTITTGSTTIYSDSISSSGVTNFIFYLYIDGNEENNLNMMNKSLVGTITVSEELAKYYLMPIQYNLDSKDPFPSATRDCYSVENDNAMYFYGDGLRCLSDQGTNFLNTPIKKAQIASLNFINNTEVPEGVTGPIDVSKDQNGTVKFYYKNSATISTIASDISLYDAFISTGNGKVYLTSGESLFSEFVSLQNLDLSNVYTDDVTNMHGMFAGCLSLTNLNLTNFNTTKVTDMSFMFSASDSSNYIGNSLPEATLQKLDLTNFNTSKVTDMSYMFDTLKNLTTIYTSNTFTTSSVADSSYMFYNTSKLVGGNGTKYNSSYIDKTYARIDTSSTPGYFTLKS